MVAQAHRLAGVVMAEMVGFPVFALNRLVRATGRILLLFCCLPVVSADSIRVKDLGKLQGWRDNALVGYGIVTGLAGTGDSPTNPATRQALSNVFSQFNLAIPATQIQSRNVAVVLVSAALPPFARSGNTLDVTVTSAGDARSLQGGNLLLAPLKAANGKVYALAEGPLVLGGYRYDANGNLVQKNHPTTGSIPNGAKVEVSLQTEILNADREMTFVLTNPDYTTAQHVAEAINLQLGVGLAHAKDAEGVVIKVPEGKVDQFVKLVSQVENVLVEPDRRARVVINERTGTVVSGGDVRISQVVISHGELKISIVTRNAVSQPYGVIGTNSGVQTAIVANSSIDVEEQNTPGFVAPGANTVADLIRALARIKTSTRDVISILQAIKAAGALHAELVIQ